MMFPFLPRVLRLAAIGLAWAGLTCLLSPTASAATPPAAVKPYQLPRTEVLAIHSRHTGQDYRIYVGLPRSYAAQPRRRYPSLFALDADYSFALAQNISEHLSDRGHIAELIVIGIGYADRDAYRANRTRDYTPTFVAEGGYSPEIQRLSGGGPKFRDFIVKELLPLLASRYRLSDDRALSGHSFGGLFAAWCLMQGTPAFNRFLGVSPSLWYDDGLLLDRQRLAWPASSAAGVQAYFGIGERENGGGGRHPMVDQLRQWAASAPAATTPQWRLRTEVLPGETHDTVYPTALTHGLLQLFPPADGH